MWKPQHLGTKIKDIVLSMSKLMLWLKIQGENDRLRRKEYIQLGATAFCVMRGVKDISSSYSHIEEPTDDGDEPGQPEGKDQKILYNADSWFRSVKTAENVMKRGNYCTMIINTAHSRFQKKMVGIDNGRFSGRCMDCYGRRDGGVRTEIGIYWLYM